VQAQLINLQLSLRAFSLCLLLCQYQCLVDAQACSGEEVFQDHVVIKATEAAAAVQSVRPVRGVKKPSVQDQRPATDPANVSPSDVANVSPSEEDESDSSVAKVKHTS